MRIANKSKAEGPAELQSDGQLCIQAARAGFSTDIPCLFFGYPNTKLMEHPRNMFD